MNVYLSLMFSFALPIEQQMIGSHFLFFVPALSLLTVRAIVLTLLCTSRTDHDKPDIAYHSFCNNPIWLHC